MRLVLASRSPRRRDLLALAGLSFEVLPAEIDETRQPGEPPTDYVCRLSREKAQAAVSLIDSPALIMASDTIVVDGDDVLGKPRDPEHAVSILRRLRGRTHFVYTAVTLFDSPGGQMQAELAGSPVAMRAYSDAEIAAYVASGDPFDKAGAYAIQNTDFHPVEGFSHCFANVMGLPLCHVTRLLGRMGITLQGDIAAACQLTIRYDCVVFGSILSGGS